MSNCVAILVSILFLGLTEGKPLSDVDRETIAQLRNQKLVIRESTVTGKRMITVDIRVNQLTPDNVLLIRKIVGPYSMCLFDQDINGENIGLVSQHSNLMALELINCSISDSIVAMLSGLPKLERLSLVSPKRLTDDGLKSLANLQLLRSLSVENAEITGTGLKDLCKLKYLQHLSLKGCKISNESTKAIKSFSRMARLDLSKCTVGDEAMWSLVELPNLRSVHLDGTQVTEMGLFIVCSNKNMRFVYLRDTRIPQGSFDFARKTYPNVTVVTKD